MFEKIALRTAQILYLLAIGIGAIWFAWLCLSHLPVWGAVLAFGILGVPVALVLAPLAAAGAGLAGVVVGLIASISNLIVRRVRDDG
ncbi:hypothetical protein [Pseudomonas sp. SLFW]|jgi:hypothetical protein|uniref:hypothetical protein n=1 Tax=Pseudomonas sp. SLFW TaxID=2683259 RepID=UPI001412A054|nr:hypothetical protein [Pseudomonas sp. SLFW]NBB09345.1 hypothetical protein [Pseudomonas sp. SLFW]